MLGTVSSFIGEIYSFVLVANRKAVFLSIKLMRVWRRSEVNSTG